MNLYTSIFLILSLLFAPALSFSEECSKSVECEFYINKQWDLMRRPDGKAGRDGEKINSPSMQDVYVMLRGNQYYLVKESDSNDKSFVIVGIEKLDGQILFNRVIYFSIAMQASAQRGYNVWSADELALTTPQRLSEFSWDLASQWRDNFKSGAASPQKITIQDGFRSIESFVHDINGKIIGRRAYVYSAQLDVTPESLVCFEACPTSQIRFSGELRGGIGKYPVELSIDNENSLIRGEYRYQNKSNKLYLSGRQDGESIFMNEYLDGALKKMTGEFSAIRRGNVFSGLWVAKPQGRKFPFFAVRDGI
ncbi:MULTISPECIES: hypothetical protein [Burkholderia]|jgi:hypothetical protein|uniref:Lipoprotein n=1 Tax=Burkholderia contaminans TaxID=488447 RepID=A0A250L2F2_9BURK|nr:MULTISPECIES: hypothetical protein [Burkholderia]UTP25806.1 hypothetical protein NMB33_21925 [Burkholderia sp. FXe9]MBH9687409.1 hypothetical protein [Burkholderia contaminans]MBK1898930.1 hypothetical protein [Burkholderia contaminans]MBK1906988.1 hypothetical protein [Burkholderia contaminans]MBK1920981.1 hypothetical protein [Burkholderia contaminans]